MPGEQSEPIEDAVASTRRLAAIDLSSILPRLSLEAGLTVFLSAGLLLFLLSRSNYLLIHALIELSNIALLTAIWFAISFL